LENDIKYYINNNMWTFEKGLNSVYKKYTFKSFISAFSWMTEVALNVELNDHHPEWKNIYNKVEVILTTHDKKKVTHKDLVLAKIMDEAFEKYT
jgi:4a-hydroxytetrahydrobiopterin dehydratase